MSNEDIIKELYQKKREEFNKLRKHDKKVLKLIKEIDPTLYQERIEIHFHVRVIKNQLKDLGADPDKMRVEA